MKKILSRLFCSLPEKAGKCLAPFVLLLLRVVWGVQLLQAGYGKLTHLERTTKYFESLHIPEPALQAHLVGGLECVGGAFLVLGLMSRLISVPLAVIMVVAASTAERDVFLGTAEKPVQGFDIVANFFTTTPGPFLVVLLVIFAFGPGLFSLDAALCKLCGRCACKRD